MTAAATIIGMVPVALALGEGGEARAPMAVIVIGGMITSTVLTLVVVPVSYLLFDRMVTARSTRWIVSKLFGSDAQPPPRGSLPAAASDDSSDIPDIEITP
jgi:HAE1 family hydrophobic/amphiphilic exporter-1